MPSPPPQTAAPLLERTLEVASEGRCRLRVPRADVTLSVGPNDEAHVTITASGGSSETAQALAERLQVRYAEKVLRVEPSAPPRPDARTWRTLREGAPVLHVHVQVPARFGADVHASGGTIEANGLGGAVTLEAMGGTLLATRITGRLDVHARHCQATVEDFEGQKCSIRLHGGQLTVRRATAQTLKVESSAARLQLEEVEAALHVAAQSGRLRIGSLRGPLDAEVCGADCVLSPEAGQAVRLQAPGSHIRLHVADLSADVRLSAHVLDVAGLEGFEGERSPRQVDGTLNGGGALIEATAPGGVLQGG